MTVTAKGNAMGSERLHDSQVTSSARARAVTQAEQEQVGAGEVSVWKGEELRGKRLTRCPQKAEVTLTGHEYATLLRRVALAERHRALLVERVAHAEKVGERMCIVKLAKTNRRWRLREKRRTKYVRKVRAIMESQKRLQARYQARAVQIQTRFGLHSSFLPSFSPTLSPLP